MQEGIIILGLILSIIIPKKIKNMKEPIYPEIP
jgi:hypothetical protein